MGEEFLEDQIEDNGKKAANADISFSPWNSNLNGTLKLKFLYRKKITKKRKLTSKIKSSNDLIKKNFFWCTPSAVISKRRPEERELDAEDRLAAAIADDLRQLSVRAKTSGKK